MLVLKALIAKSSKKKVPRMLILKVLIAESSENATATW